MYKVSTSPGPRPLYAHATRHPWQCDLTLRSGHPAIWKDGKLFEEACRWLNEEIVPIRPSAKTWTQAAQSLLTWLDFLEASEIDWQHAGKEDLIAYRDAYLGAISPQTGKTYSANTVAVRMTYIIDFLRFAVAHEWIDSDLGAGSMDASLPRARTNIDQDALAHIRKGSSSSVGGSRETAARLYKLKPKAKQNDTVRVISREEFAALRRWTGPRPSERQPDDGGSDRDYVVFALGWACGMRVQEIADVDMLPLLAMTVSPADIGTYYKLSITGKGNKTRLVDVPGWLVLDLQAYIDGARKRALKKRGRTAEEAKLILNCEHSSRPGKPMTKSAMQDLMRRACAGAGLMTEVRKTNPETGEVVIDRVPKFSMHSLRHTYAVMTYHNHRKWGYGDLDAWKYLQKQLGHEKPSTTINIYLHHISVWSNFRAGRTLLEMLD